MSGHSYDVAIIGGGASGIMTAIAIKRANRKLNVCIIEKNDRIGKKLLLTGNSRCNLSNRSISYKNYITDDYTFLKSVLKQVSTGDVINYFESLGVLCKFDSEGRVYPYSDRASSVLEAFRLELQALGVIILTEFDVTTVEKTINMFKIMGNKRYILSKKVVFACGGKASPKTGSDGKIYNVIASFDHKINKGFPALSPITIADEYLGILQGVRAKAEITVLENGVPLTSRFGEIQFKKDAISGICVLDLSKYISNRVANRKSVKDLKLSINFLPNLSLENVAKLMTNRSQAYRFATLEQLFSLIVHKRVAIFAIKKTGLTPNDTLETISGKNINRVIYTLKNSEVKPTDVYGFSFAQVSGGGVSCKEINFETMESKKAHGLYVVGEALDVAGDCGGYNLHFAWVSAITCGKAFIC